MRRYDVFPLQVLAVLGVLEGKNADEMARSLLNQEEELVKEMHEHDKI